jgi:sugar O-acyltransferase (sialic acid O-acetyltransferase NeuD family)
VKRRLVIGGDSAFAQIAYEYFTHDSHYDVVAFTVEREYVRSDALFDLPVVPFEDLPTHYPPSDHAVYMALTYTQMNRTRTRLADAAAVAGYELASYVSSSAFVWRNVEVGEHSFVFEDNTLQPFVKLGRNVVLWSGNHIGHHSTVGANCFVSSHVVVSGFVTIGENCFLGVNSTFANNVEVGRDTWVAPSTTVLHDVEPESFLKPTGERGSKSPLEYFGLGAK